MDSLDLDLGISNELIHFIIVIAAAAAGAYLLYRWFFQPAQRGKFGKYTIEVITSYEAVATAVKKLERQNPHQVLGFGCKGFYNAVALLQLANSDNYCAVFDLHRLGGMPKELEDLLEDRKIWKVGVGPDNDFMKLLRNYGVRMQARLDLRNISRQLMLGNGGTLQNMADKYIAAKLNNRPFRHVDWYARPLPIELINYAADDAIAGIKIFEEFVSYATSIYGPRKEVLRTFEKHVDANFASNLPPWF